MKAGYVIGAMALACLLLFPPRAVAQTNVAVVTTATTYQNLPTSQIFSDITSAINYYTTWATTNTGHFILLITPGTWPLPASGIVIGPKMDIEIDGTGPDPSTVILTGSSGVDGIEFQGSLVSGSISSSGATATVTTTAAHAFVPGDSVTISGASPTDFNGTFTVATVSDTTHFTYTLSTTPATSASGVVTVELANPPAVTVEGLTITSAKDGIWVHSNPQATIARCFIRDNASNGVLCEDGSTPNIINCSLKNNAVDGVSIAGTADPNIAFCTIFGNKAHGIYVGATGAKAVIYDTVVFSNGGGGATDQGGIIAVSGAEGGVTGDHDVAVGNTGLDVSAGIVATLTNPPTGITAVSDLDINTGDWGTIGAASKLIDQAVTPTISGADRFLAVDFLGHTRPFGTGPDIGADEYGAGFGGTPGWSYCVIYPFPTGQLQTGAMPVIGKTPAGGLSGQFRLTNVSPSDTVTAILVPQGTTEAAEWALYPNSHIPLQVTVLGAGNYSITNDQNIDTILGTDQPPAGPSTTDVIADGHAVMYVRVNGVDISTGLIADQVEKSGRHVLIDTIPPRLQIAATGEGAPSFVNYVGTPVAGPPAALPDSLHIGLLPLPGTWRAFALPSYDDGLIFPTPGSSNGAQAFFNPGSISNGYPTTTVAANLNVSVFITVEDPPVEDVTTHQPIPGLDEWTNLTNRQVAGFADTSLPPDTNDLTVDQALTGTPLPGTTRYVDWVFATGGLPHTTTVNTAYSNLTDSAEVGSNTGYDPVSGNATKSIPNQMTVTWTFNDPRYGHGSGIPYPPSSSQMAVRFRVHDAANNSAADSALLDPLHLWWLTSTSTRIQPNYEGTQVEAPNFTWALDRGFNTNAAGQPQPLFMYRIWENKTNDYNGQYVPVTPWSGWSANTALTSQDLDSLGITANYSGHWLLLAVVGADEAGNVEPWPSTGLVMDASENLTASAASGANWQRFYLKGPSDVLDTTATADFWWNNFPPNATVDPGETDLGPGPIVASPPDLTRQRLEVRFHFNLIGGDSYLASGNTTRALKWELVREDEANQISGLIVPPASATTADLVLPLDAVNSAHLGNLADVFAKNGASNYWHLGDPTLDPQLRQPVHYVLRAYTCILDSTGNAMVLDPTPANYHFTVVGNVSSYIQNKNNGEFQPIKVQQEK